MFPKPGSNETLDVIGKDQLLLFQSKEGYRFSIDSLLLWGFLNPDPKDRWIDLGTGCGILAIALAKINGAREVVGLELQPELVAIARRNARLNRVETRVTFLEGDIRDTDMLKSLAPADGVCANPPYYPADSGRINPDPQKAVARHEIRGSMLDFIKAGSRLLRRGGVFATIIPVQRLQETLQALNILNLNLSRMRFTHSYEGQPATLVLLEALKDKRSPLSVEPPLIIYTSPKTYTEEVKGLMAFESLKRF